MRKLILITITVVASSMLFAQQRYLDEVFTDVSITQDVTYGWARSVFRTGEDTVGTSFGGNILYVDSLKMDVYTPTGDAATDRPVILLSHAGSFLPQSFVSLAFQVPANTLGTENDSCLVELCKRFAKRGYVAIAFTYRVGWNALAPTFEERTDGIINAVYKAMHDSKSLIRHLKLNSATYGIDTTKIALGGSNSGAYVGLLASNLNRPEELDLNKFKDNMGDPFIDTAIWGNYEGKNGLLEYYDNAGPSSDFQLVFSLGGCVGDTSWVDQGEEPIIAFHGTNDASPFATGIVVTGSGQPVIEVSGPGNFIPLADAYGNQDVFDGGGFAPAPPSSIDGIVYEASYPFYGVGFEPWGWYSTNPLNNPSASKARAMAYIDTIMSYGTPRIYKALIDPNYTVGIEDRQQLDVNLDIFPNPSATGVTIRLFDQEHTIKTVEVYDVTGKLIKTEETMNSDRYKLSREGIQPGVHFVKVKFTKGGEVFKKVVFE